MFTRLNEGKRAGEFIVWEVDPRWTRGKIEVTAPADKPVQPGTVVQDPNDPDVAAGVTIYEVNRGRTKVTSIIKSGPAIVNENLLTFPIVTGDVAATDALRATLIADLETKDIRVEPEGGNEIVL
ncbi:hypothetical protein SAMN06297251_10145 [Fulvimarina manganoxydans]|uniref:Uncharacterized protein n=1 Tax=Fulvimarina manganoxydans TaxID=937218 RepID=A0A1W1Y9U5_9HYPH|nr:head decoration protein [Fulvimarina manganoxydans]SMC32528.1 hypothetical protein SAMN06297251_10145 [Fulvimarina manganoxydans]